MSTDHHHRLSAAHDSRSRHTETGDATGLRDPARAPTPRLVTQDEFERQLALIRAKVKDPTEGIFGPSSKLWEIAQHSSAFLGAGRALLLQLAHPWVATAVAQHSRVQEDAFGRFQRTFLFCYTCQYGSLEQALHAAQRLYRMHSRITGHLTEDVGLWRRGTYYQANEVNALMWVFATLHETLIRMYELVVGPLSDTDKDAYYQEAKLFAGLMGIPREALPACWDDFLVYNEDMWGSEVLGVGRAAKELHRALFRRPGLASPLLSRYELFTASTMPPRLREAFDLPPDTVENRRTFETYVTRLRRVYPHLPARLRTVPPHFDALRRLAGKRGPDLLTRLMNRVFVGQSRLVS